MSTSLQEPVQRYFRYAIREAATFVPHALLRDPCAEWSAPSDELIVASWDIGPERPEVQIRIDQDGAIRSTSSMRWGKAGQADYGYIPCGCEVHAEKRFGDFIVPSRVTVGWWFGTTRHAPFFRAGIDELRPAKSRSVSP